MGDIQKYISFFITENELVEILINWKVTIGIILLEILIIRIYFRIPKLWIIKKEEEIKNANDTINYLLYSDTKDNK